MVPGEPDGDQHQQDGKYPVEGCGAHAGSPGGPHPGADEAAGEHVDYHVPVAAHGVKGDGHQTAGRAVTTTIRLIALFMITACRAAKPNRPMSSGSRNSAPPRPSWPPRSPTPAPVASAAESDLALAGAATASVDGRTYHSDTLVGATPGSPRFPTERSCYGNHFLILRVMSQTAALPYDVPLELSKLESNTPGALAEGTPGRRDRRGGRGCLSGV